MEKVNIAGKLKLFEDHWSPKPVGSEHVATPAPVYSGVN